jgi:hypothetical protein
LRGTLSITRRSSRTATFEHGVVGGGLVEVSEGGVVEAGAVEEFTSGADYRGDADFVRFQGGAVADAYGVRILE